MNYKKICTSEAIALIVVVMINQVLLGTAKEIITDTASSAWIHTILISAIAILFTFLICKLFSKFTNLDIIDISEFLAGKVLKYIVCIGLIGFFLLSATLILNHIANCLNIIYLTNLNVLFLILIFLIAAIVVAKKDIGVIARTNLIVLSILIIPMIILFVSIASDMQINNLFPILGYGINETFFSNTTNLYAFNGLVYLFLITPLLKDSNEHKKIGIISIIISSLYLFLTVISLLMSFPFASVTDDLLSIYLLSRLVSFGTFLERVDVIYVFLWILSSFSYLSIIFYFLTSAFQKMTKLKNRNGILYSLGTIVLGLTILMKDIADLRFAHQTISMYYFLILFAILFIILLLAYLKKRKRKPIAKKRKEKKNMKKTLTFIGLVLLILLILSTRHNTTSESIENLAYVIAIGIDNADNGLIELTLQIATPSSDSSGGSSSSSSGQSSQATTTSVECSSINSGLNMVNSYISKKLNLSHCKIVVFSEEFATGGIGDEIATLANNVQIRPDCSIVISKCDAKDFININEPVLVTLTARFYEVIVRSGDYTGYSTNITLLDFYKALKETSSEPVAILAGINVPSTHTVPTDINYIDLDSSYSAGEAFITNNNNMQISGLAVFHEGYLIGELTAIDSICHLLLKNNLQSSMISIADPFNSTEIINLSLTQYTAPDISVKVVNGSPYITCNVHLKANIVSLASGSDFSKKENLQIISEYANSYLTYHIENYLYKTSKDYGSDTVGFGRFIIHQYPTLNDWYNYDWNANYKNAFFKVNVDTTITNSNLILKN